MNYYIQGNKGKADQIKAAFEKLGYDISWPGGCANPDVINIGVERNGAKYVVAETSEYIKDIIKTHPDYKELEQPIKPNFKVGNWIVHTDGSSDIPIQVYGLKKDRYLVTNMLGTKSKVILTYQDKWRLWTIQDAKDGDVLATDNGWTCIFKLFDGCVFSSYCFMDSQKWFCEFGSEAHTLDSRINGNIHPATKEQRELLFKKMKESGYEWDEEKKELSKIKPHYDIKNFHAGMPVLVRADNDCCWDYSVFSRVTGNEYWHFALCNGVSFTQCIPFNEETKHLLGTNDMPSEEYINW